MINRNVKKLRRLRLTIELPFVIPLPDDEYLCRLKQNQEFKIGLELVAEKTDKTEVDNSFVIKPYTGEVTAAGSAVEIPGAGGRHTRAYVDFFIKHSKHDMTETEELKWKAMSRRYLNAFLDSYRVRFKDSRVYLLSPSEFYAIRFGRAPRWWQIAFDGSKSMGATFGDYPLELRHIPELSADRVSEFRAVMAADVSVSIVDSLIMDAKTHSSRGDFRRTVTDCGTALDITVEAVAVELLRRNGSLDQYRKEWLAKVSPKVIVEKCIAQHLEEPLLGTNAWKTYESKIRILRNAVIHDGYEPTNDESANTIAVVDKLVRWLSEKSGTRL